MPVEAPVMRTDGTVVMALLSSMILITATLSLHLDNDFPLGSTLLKIRKSLLGLVEGKYLVDDRPNAPRFKQRADLGQLTTVRVREQERIRDAALPGAADDLAAEQP